MGRGTAVALGRPGAAVCQAAEVEALVHRIDTERGRLNILVNDIWGGEDLIEWNTAVGSRSGRRAADAASTVDTHLLTSYFALPLPIRPPGGLVVEMTDRTRENNAGHYRLHGAGPHAGLDAVRDDARTLRRHGDELT